MNYHSAGQLLNASFGFITNRPSDDDTLSRSITGTDGDAAVDPYQPDQASDLYVTHGETIDWGYFQFGTIGFTAEMDQAATAGAGSGANQFVFPDDEAKVQAVVTKNLRLALNLAVVGAAPRHAEQLLRRSVAVPGQADARHPADDVRLLLRRRAADRGDRPPLARPGRRLRDDLRPRRHEPLA